MNDDVTPLLTLDTLRRYLENKQVNAERSEQNGNQYLQMMWKFDMGDAAVLMSLQDGPNNTSRLEITCVTHNQYRGRRQQVLEMLNQRNRERHFSRSIDQDGNVWLEYVGFYPTAVEFPENTFDTLFGGVLAHFQDDYAALEGYQPPAEA
jgi:hypothetical protein